MTSKPIHLEGFITDPINGECRSPSGAYSFVRGDDGLIRVSDKHGHRSSVGASDEAAAHLATFFAPREIDMEEDDDLDNEVFQFVVSWDRMVAGAEIATSFDAAPGAEHACGPFRIAKSDGYATVTNRASSTYWNDLSFGVTRDPGGEYSLVSTDGIPVDGDLRVFADELSRANFGVERADRNADDDEFVTGACVFLRSYDTAQLRTREASGCR